MTKQIKLGKRMTNKLKLTFIYVYIPGMPPRLKAPVWELFFDATGGEKRTLIRRFCAI